MRKRQYVAHVAHNHVHTRRQARIRAINELVVEAQQHERAGHTGNTFMRMASYYASIRSLKRAAERCTWDEVHAVVRHINRLGEKVTALSNAQQARDILYGGE